ncbi:hypothetical protein EYF80_061092 [Liparis tanakae]|uniref:Ig-like domain-containing protein n=1 Tax=Liparis tanakae TaxID=230148 RepID=A0A4Z2EJK1_9TELE|nr:hypothetical protein EYF80_061092 [Liparis tanakae]
MKSFPHRVGEDPQLVFRSIQSSDSGMFYCEAENHLGTRISEFVSIDVKSSYTWYKGDEEEPAASGPIFIINDFRDEHSGRYRCDAENNRGLRYSTLNLADYKGRATNSCPMPTDCGLVIRDLKESDSKMYRCVFIGRSALQVKVISVTVLSSHIQVNLSCSSICGGPSYRWSLNQQDVPGDRAVYTGSLKPGDGISCRLIANFTWYKEDQPRPLSEDPQLVFSSIQASDSGHYSCAAETQLGKKTSESISIDVKCEYFWKKTRLIESFIDVREGVLPVSIDVTVVTRWVATVWTSMCVVQRHLVPEVQIATD